MELQELLSVRKNLKESLEIIESNLQHFEWQLLAKHRLSIEAIKAYRKQHGGSLHEAKLIVDDYIDSNK